MKYKVKIIRRAQSSLQKIKGNDYERIKAAIYALADNPRPPGCKKLTGREGWRIRVGRYRVIYEIEDDELTVLVVHIGHRKEIYR